VAVGAACLLAAIPEWLRPGLEPGMGIDRHSIPEAACDFMKASGVAGRGFTIYPFGGYLLWRFWPDRERLPFMDVHQSGTAEIRGLYQEAFTDPGAWSTLDRRYRFDYVLLQRMPPPGETLLDRLDADSTWALVFLDDLAALYARRTGRLAALAQTSGYRWLRAGPERARELRQAARRSPTLASGLFADLKRQIYASPANASAWNLTGCLLADRFDLDDARVAFRHAVVADEVIVPGAHSMIARIALLERRPREALDEVAAARRLTGDQAALDALEGRAWQALGEPRRARASYVRALGRDVQFTEARDSLAALEAR